MKKLVHSLYTYIKMHPKIDYIVLGLALLAFLVITLVNAPRASIWFDEAFSAYLAQFSFWDIARFTAADVHPPFYYWLVKIWVSIFGTTELAYRSLSILFGAGATVTAFVLSRKFFGRKVAGLTLAFTAFSPMLIRYSDEARMYTLAAFIVMLATYVMVRALESGSKKHWLWYGALVSIGMWTHYFTALAWLAHWVWRGTQVWRKDMKFKQFSKAFFTKEWLRTYIFAVALFVPWLPFMALQLGVVQGGGFWIGPVGVDTPANYLTNYFYYLEHGQVRSWFALAMLIVVIVAIVATPRAYRLLTAKEKKSFLLVASLTWTPPVLLFFASLPPLRSSFVERYLVPSIVALSMYLAVVLIVGTRRWRMSWRVVPSALVVLMMLFGITKVYYYGNYNKNSNTHILTRQVIKAAQQASPKGTPIVAIDPWIFYEAAPYATKDYPVYFIDENTEYKYGSLDMLKYTDLNKIKDLEAFKKQHPVIWYIANTQDEDAKPYQESWEVIETVSIPDHISGKTSYKATKYRVNAE